MGVGLEGCHLSDYISLQIIERSLPKKQKVKKDPCTIEREEMEQIGKYWINIVKKDIPKHHRSFTNFHRKQLIDAKRLSETCQREVCITFSGSFSPSFFFLIYLLYHNRSLLFYPACLYLCFLSHMLFISG